MKWRDYIGIMFKRVENLWREYLAWGFAFAIILSLVDYSHDSFACVYPVLIFILIDGIKENGKIILSFIREYAIVAIFVAIEFVYFLFQNELPVSYRLPIAAFVVAFAGYRIGVEGEAFVKAALIRLAILVLVTIFAGVLWKITNTNYAAHYFQVAGLYFESYWNRLMSVYVHPIIAASVFMSVMLIMVFMSKKKLYSLFFAGAGMLPLILTMSRGALITYCMGLVAYCALNKKREWITEAVPHIDWKIKVVGLVVLIGALVAFAVSRLELIKASLAMFIDRFVHMQGVDNQYRVDAVVTTLKDYARGSIPDIIMGKGMQQAYNMLDVNEGLIQKYGIGWPGPIDNTFISVLYDFGLIGEILFVLMLVFAFAFLVKSKSRLVCGVAVAVISLLIQGLTTDFEYWCTTSFLLYSSVGLLMGLYKSESCGKLFGNVL